MYGNAFSVAEKLLPMQALKSVQTGEGFYQIQIPKHTILLSAETRGDCAVLYMLMDASGGIVVRNLRVVGTGFRFDLPTDWKYVGTVSFGDAHATFHLFDCGEE